MEASYRERPSRVMDGPPPPSSNTSKDGSRRRSLTKTGSGRRRRRPGDDDEQQRLHDSSTMNSMAGDASGYSYSKRSTMEASGYTRNNSSGGSSNSGGGSRRRHSVATNGGEIMIGSGASGMDHPTNYYASDKKPPSSSSSSSNRTRQASENRYEKKLRAAHEVLQQYHSQQIRQHQTPRQASKRTITVSDKYKLISRVANQTASEAQKRQVKHQQQHVLQTPKSSSRRQSLAAVVDIHPDEAIAAKHLRRSSMPGVVSPRGVTRAASSSRTSRPESTATASRLRKAFSHDGAPPTPSSPPPMGEAFHHQHHDHNRSTVTTTTTNGQHHPRHHSIAHAHNNGIIMNQSDADGGASPLRGARRQYSGEGDANDRHSTGSGSGHSRGSRRMSMPLPISTHSEGSHHSGSSGERRQRQRQNQRRPKDMASRTSWNTPKSKNKASFNVQELLDSSMPSLTALDLSIHTGSAEGGGAKRLSDSIALLTLGTHEMERDEQFSPPRKTKSDLGIARPGLNHAPSISLLVDNAPSHALARSAQPREVFDYDSADEASTICNSVGDYYGSTGTEMMGPSSDSNNYQHNNNTHFRDDMMGRSEGGGLSRRHTYGSDENARARSDHSGRMGARSGRMDGSRADASGRRRGGSFDDGAVDVSRRRRGNRPGAPKSLSGSSSRGGDNSMRRGSARTLDTEERDRRSTQRRASTSAAMARSSSRDRGAFRGNSSSSFHNKPSAHGRGSRNSSPVTPRRQKSSSSLASRGEGTRTPRQMRKGRSKSMATGTSMSQVETDTTWVRLSAKSAGNATVGPLDLAVVDRINNKGKPPQETTYQRKSSSMSVGASSLGSGSGRSRRSVPTGRRPRRHPSSGSASVASMSSSSGRERNRSARAPPPEPRSSDATWSLADIDAEAASRLAKAEMDASVTTPPTVSSSSVEDRPFSETPSQTRKGVRRSKSMGSQKGRTGGVTATLQDESDPFESPTRNPFDLNAAEVDPFRAQDDDDDDDDDDDSRADPFGLCSSDPFAARGANLDPFHLGKPNKERQLLSAAAKSLHTDEMDDPSFHMTNDFGDFEDESFGPVSFDDSSSHFG